MRFLQRTIRHLFGLFGPSGRPQGHCLHLRPMRRGVVQQQEGPSSARSQPQDVVPRVRAVDEEMQPEVALNQTHRQAPMSALRQNVQFANDPPSARDGRAHGPQRLHVRIVRQTFQHAQLDGEPREIARHRARPPMRRVQLRRSDRVRTELAQTDARRRGSRALDLRGVPEGVQTALESESARTHRPSASARSSRVRRLRPRVRDAIQAEAAREFARRRETARVRRLRQAVRARGRAQGARAHARERHVRVRALRQGVRERAQRHAAQVFPRLGGMKDVFLSLGIVYCDRLEEVEERQAVAFRLHVHSLRLLRLAPLLDVGRGGAGRLRRSAAGRAFPLLCKKRRD